MRVCLVTPYDLTHEGGVNSHVRALAHMLRSAGHHASVLGPASGAVPPECDGVAGTIPIPANGSIARVGLLVSAPSVTRYLTRGRFDIIHVHEPYVPGTARLAVRRAPAPVVATFHAYAERERGISRATRHVMARPLTRLRRAIAASTAAADFARVVYRGPIRVIPNGIDMTAFSCGPAAAVERTAEPLRILFVGRYDEPRKGLRYFLDAAARLRAEGRQLIVSVAGRGTPGAVAGLARRAGARFLGPLDHAGLAAAYRDCDVFCAPSVHGESFGIVLLEAMACGRPVVASDIRGYREAAAGAAMLVQPGDAAALAAALAALGDDVALRQELVQRGLRRAAELDWCRMAQQVISVYRAAS